ncbi:uncharacterized protein I303_105004 [Kwoniella dejecticola CBS 10117]|uniref:Uncharacterized protein n=1 Tax=Kwoniella dejecticola CBS 10117 TaxID=1296121 RepID=A0AAJ8MID5_9TREE
MAANSDPISSEASSAATVAATSSATGLTNATTHSHQTTSARDDDNPGDCWTQLSEWPVEESQGTGYWFVNEETSEVGLFVVGSHQRTSRGA